MLAALRPGLELLEAPLVHADLALAAAFAAADEDRAASAVEVELAESCLLDAQTGAPEQPRSTRVRGRVQAVRQLRMTAMTPAVRGGSVA